MRFLNELLGFAVLTGPLWLILVVLPIAMWIAAKAAKRFERRSAKIAVSLLAFLFVIFMPFVDEISGRIYFNHLCTTQAGVRVYHTVELPNGYWTEEGKPKFYEEKTGNFKLEGYRVEHQTGTHSAFFHIDIAGYRRIKGDSGLVLGEVINFRYGGGWMRRNLSPHNTANSCEGGIERSTNLIKQIFKQKTS